MTPLRISGGLQYIIAGTGTGDWGHNVGRADLLWGPGFSMQGWVASFTTGLSYPNTSMSTTVMHMGANFLYQPVTCTADFNGDGDSGTDADIEAFFQCLAGSCCPLCPGQDFNGDGDIGTDGDIEAFFRVLAGNPC